MEGGILEVVVIECDEDGEREEEERQAEREEAGARVREGGVTHEAGSVYHGQFVDELHGIFERCVKEEAAGPNQQVANEADDKNGVMAVFAAGLNASVGEVDKEEVGEGIDYLGGIWGRVVVLTGTVSGANGMILVGDLQTSSHQLMVEVTGSQ